MFWRQPGVTMAPCLSPASASLKFPTGLETSTSFGVPVLGCHCATCTNSVGEPVPAASTPLAYVPGRARAATVLVAVLDNQIAGTVTYGGDAGSHLAEHQREGEASLRMLAVPPARGQWQPVAQRARANRPLSSGLRSGLLAALGFRLAVLASSFVHRARGAFLRLA